VKKNRGANVGYIIVEVLFAIIFIYAAVQLYSIFSDYKRASDEYSALAETVVTEVEEVIAEEQQVENETAKKTESVLELPYDYEVPDYKVDENALKTQNPDTVGWIILPDSKINYPIVKSKDNTEYLTTTFEGQTANSGAIFLDMYCPSDFSSDNVIIYGHNMKNGSMFRALNHMTDKEYFWRHHIFCIDIGNGFEKYEVISCYETVETDLSSWQISFESQESYEAWLKNIVKRCNYDCVDYDVTKQTITLSTCRGKSGGPGRFIVHLQKK
jgi:sortase B